MYINKVLKLDQNVEVWKLKTCNNWEIHNGYADNYEDSHFIETKNQLFVTQHYNNF